MPLSYKTRRRIGWVLFVIAARVLSFWTGGHPWQFGQSLSTWLTWTLVLAALVANQPFDRRHQQLERAPRRRATDLDPSE